MIRRQTPQQVYASPPWLSKPYLQLPTDRPTMIRPSEIPSQNPSRVAGRWLFRPFTPTGRTAASIVAGDLHSLPLIVMNQRRQTLEPLIARKSPW